MGDAKVYVQKCLLQPFRNKIAKDLKNKLLYIHDDILYNLSKGFVSVVV